MYYILVIVDKVVLQTLHELNHLMHKVAKMVT